MKASCIIFFLFLGSVVSAQSGISTKVSTEPGYRAGNDSLPTVRIVKPEANDQDIAFIINGVIIDQPVVECINPKNIANVFVSKKAYFSGDRQYRAQIQIKLMDGYAPEFISLKTLANEYLGEKTVPALFMIDDKVIRGDYSSLFADVNYILSITADPLNDGTSGHNLYLVRILTRSEENIRKSKEISIRGKESLSVL